MFSLNIPAWRITCILAFIAPWLTLVLAQNPPAPACAVTCVGEVASGDMCSGTTDVGCLCAIAEFTTQVSNCIQQQCDSSDFQAASNYLQAFCATASVVAGSGSTLASSVATAATSAAGSAASVAASAASSAITSAIASATSRAGSAASVASSIITSATHAASSAVSVVSSLASSAASSHSSASASASSSASSSSSGMIQGISSSELLSSAAIAVALFFGAAQIV